MNLFRFQSKLRRNRSKPRDTDFLTEALFVYGTLKRGFFNYSRHSWAHHGFDRTCSRMSCLLSGLSLRSTCLVSWWYRWYTWTCHSERYLGIAESDSKAGNHCPSFIRPATGPLLGDRDRFIQISTIHWPFIDHCAVGLNFEIPQKHRVCVVMSVSAEPPMDDLPVVLSQEIRGRAIQIQDARFNEPMLGIATWQAVFVGDGCTIESYPMVVRTQVGLGLTKKWFCSKSLLDDRGISKVQISRLQFLQKRLERFEQIWEYG